MVFALVLGTALGLSGVLAAEDEADLRVRTVERGQIQRDDERRPSVMVTRVNTEGLMGEGREIGDALGEVGGVYVRRESSFGQSAYLSVRGGNARQVVVEVEGLRLRAPAGVGFDLGQMTGVGIESVDVYRGSGAALYGSGAVTGAVRLNPEQAPREGWEARAQAMGGSFGSGGVSLSAGAGGGGAGVRFFGGYRRSGGDFSFLDEQGVEDRRINNDHARVSAGSTAQLAWDDQKLRAVVMWESGEAGSAGVSEFQRSFSAARTEDHRGLMALRWEGLGLWRGERWEVDGFATAGAQERGFRYSNDDGFLTGERFENRGRYRGAAVTAGLVGVGQAHMMRLDVEGRLEGYESRSRSLRDQALGADRRVAALTIGDEWLVFQERLSLVGALRGEVIVGSAGDFGAETASERWGRPFLPAIGAIWRVNRHLEVRGNGARTFRMPDFDELYLDTEGVRGNRDLRPEEAWTADLAVGFESAEGRFQGQVGVFQNWIDSMILFLPVSHTLFEAQNLEGAITRGAEVSARAGLMRGWEMSGGYTFTQAYLLGGGAEQLPHQPRHRVLVRSEMELMDWFSGQALKSLRLTGTAHYRSRLNLDHFGNLQNGPAFRLDLGLTAGLRRGVAAALSVQNLFNARQMQDSLQRPLPGRAIYMSVEGRMGDVD